MQQVRRTLAPFSECQAAVELPTRENSHPHDYYFRDLTTAYRPGGIEPYDGARMDQLFYNAPGTEYVPAPRHPDLSEYTFEQIDDLMKVVFHFGDGMEWRWPEPHERVYHRPVGGWVAIPLEHLRSMRPNLHQFTKSLCRDVYGIPFTQLAPNSVKFPSERLDGDALVKMYDFVVALGVQWTRDTFLDNQTLFNVGCLPFLNPFHHAMSRQFKDLAGKFKKIGGSQSEVSLLGVLSPSVLPWDRPTLGLGWFLSGILLLCLGLIYSWPINVQCCYSPTSWLLCSRECLGYPDTGGQVVYIMDQVPALESEMIKRIKEQGIDIKPRI
ncbi:hypothetical protein AgCh_018231 [Apium graveolens]